MVKISELTEVTAAAIADTADIWLAVTDESGSPVSRKLQLAGANQLAHLTASNVAALATVPVQDQQTIFLRKYYASSVDGDGSGQTVRYDASSTATVDGGWVFPGLGGTLSFDAEGDFDGTAGTGRFLASDQSYADLLRFGADPMQLSDSSRALHRAMRALEAGGGGLLYCPRGDYLYTAKLDSSDRAITNPADNVVVMGEGPATKFKISDGIATGFDSNTTFAGWFRQRDEDGALSNFSVERIYFDCNGTNNQTVTGHSSLGVGVVSLEGVDGFVFRDCVVYDNSQAQAVFVQQKITDIAVRDNYLNKNVKIIGNSFIRSGAQAGGNFRTDHSCIYIQAENAEVHGNFVDNPGYDSFATTGSALFCTGLEIHTKGGMITNNHVRRCSRAVILAAQAEDVSDNVIANNTCEDNGAFLLVSVSDFRTLETSTFRGNTHRVHAGETARAAVTIGTTNDAPEKIQLTLDGNIFDYSDITTNSQDVPGINLSLVMGDLNIIGNRFDGVPGRIFNANSGLGLTGGRLVMRNNTFHNCVTNTDASDEVVAFLSGVAEVLDLVDISNNTVSGETRAVELFKAQTLVSAITCRISGNVYKQRAEAAFAEGTDVWTVAGHGMDASTPVYLTTDGALPTGFTLGTKYYTRDITTDTFKLTLVPGTSAVDGTDTGTPPFYITWPMGINTSPSIEPEFEQAVKVANVIAFADEDTTPNVSEGSYFETGNTQATTIDGFDGGTHRQIITVITLDGLTTFEELGSGNTNIELGGIGDWTPSSGGAITLMLDGTTWRQISRTDY